MSEPTFGAHHGQTIDNKDDVLKEIDDLLTGKPPAIEYLFVCPFRNTSLFGIGLGSPYGHAAVRYTLPSGEQFVMNIVKNANGNQLVNFVDPTEYLFGTKFTDVGAEQGGIYNRRIVGVRIENWDDASVQDLHYFYSHLRRRERKDHRVTFQLLLGPIYNWVGQKLPEGFDPVERGNCARWTTAGLAFAGVLKGPHIWPKKVFIDIFEKYGLADRKNVNVVLYEHVPHAKQSFGDGTPLWMESVGPYNFVSDFSYFDLKKFANVIVSVPPGSTAAVVERCENPVEPSFWRWKKTEIVFSALVGGYLSLRLYRRLTRPVAPPVLKQGDVTRIVKTRRLMRMFRK